MILQEILPAIYDKKTDTYHYPRIYLSFHENAIKILIKADKKTLRKIKVTKMNVEENNDI